MFPKSSPGSRAAVRRYGEQRGRRMALRALANGDELSMTNFLVYGEWRSGTGLGQHELGQEGPHVHMTIPRCPWALTWGDGAATFVNKINAFGWIRYNTPMQESDEFWDFYWEVNLQNMEDLGKREAILASSKLIRRLSVNPDQRVRLLELGCGEGQIIGTLVEAHTQAPSINASHGVDYSRKSIEICRRLYPGMSFTEGDFTHQDLMKGLGQFRDRAYGKCSA